ncbi:MAG: MFS transporter [Anaerolinea sp.]|nr:MFS transporter [Anaerolinea sp.]
MSVLFPLPIRKLARRVEFMMVGDLDPVVRRNMYIEFVGASLFGLFLACLNFVPVVLRRLGASPDWVALYLAQQFAGFLLNTVSVAILPKKHGLLRAAQVCWLIGRSMFVLSAFISGYQGLVALLLIFWIMESFPTPVYTRIMQVIYPSRSRGRVMSLIRVGMALATLGFTPIAGWILDTFGHQVLFPIGGIAAVLSTVQFGRLKFSEDEIPVPKKGENNNLIKILREDRRFVIYLVALVCYGFGMIMGSVIFPNVQVDRLALSYSQVGLLNTVQSTFFLIGYVILGRAIDRRGGLWTLRLTFLIAAIVPLSYMSATQGWMLAPAFAAFGMASAGLDLGFLSTAMQLSGVRRLAEYSALQTTLLGVRGLIAPFVGVFLLNQGVSETVIFALGLGLILISVAIMGIVSRMHLALGETLGDAA